MTAGTVSFDSARVFTWVINTNARLVGIDQQDESGNVVNGCIQLVDENEELAAGPICGNDLIGLLPGVYTIESISVPDGCTATTLPDSATVYTDGVDQAFVIYYLCSDAEPATLEITVTDQNGPKSGICFYVGTGTGNGVYCSDANGLVTAPGLVFGYTYIPSRSSGGLDCNLNAAIPSFFITGDLLGTIIQLDVELTCGLVRPSYSVIVVLTVVDDSGDPASGICLRVIAFETNPLEFCADEAGQIRAEFLPGNDYFEVLPKESGVTLKSAAYNVDGYTYFIQIPGLYYSAYHNEGEPEIFTLDDLFVAVGFVPGANPTPTPPI